MIANSLGVTFAVKSVDQKARRFAGLASTWDLDLGNDVIHKGAFAKRLNDWRSAKKRSAFRVSALFFTPKIWTSIGGAAAV